MNPVQDLMRAHSSVREYKKEPLDAQVIRDAVAAAQMAATSSHVQAYCAIHVTDPDERARLVELTGGQPYVAEAGAFLVICGDVRRHQLVSRRQGVEHVQNLETFLVAVIDASLFAQNLAVAFESEGLGICYIGGLRNRLHDVDRLLGIPDGVFPLYGLCVGHPLERPATKPRLPVDAVFFRDRYPDDDAMLSLIKEFDGTMSGYYRGRGLKGRDWSGGIARRFATAGRAQVTSYYRSKGAVLE